jgi:hypothetical protein
MEKNDLLSMWHEIHAGKEAYPLTITGMNETRHSRIITKVLRDQKVLILLYSVFFSLYFCLMLYAFVHLQLTLTIYSVFPLSLAGLFILFKTTSEISRYVILIKTSDNSSINDSVQFFLKKLKRIGITDLVSYLVLFYIMATTTAIIYINDMGGIKNLSRGNGMTTMLLVFIAFLLLIPWFLKYQHNQRYKKMYFSLKDSYNYLNEVS